MKRLSLFLLLAVILGCGEPAQTPKPPKPQTPNVSSISTDSAAPISVAQSTPDKPLPVFVLATSEYPSWSTFIVAGKAGLINPKKGGEYGPLELKYGVDIVVEVKDYDPCLTAYCNGATDAVAMTNMDSLNPALGRASTAIMPTSTSAGADVVIGVGNIKTIDDLKGVKVFGLEKSVSQYAHYRGLVLKGKDPKDFPFANLDPAAAATALQSGDKDKQAICVWNPFALQTLRTAKGAARIFDSSLFPGEIVDMVVIGNDSLVKPGGENFAIMLCKIQYEVNRRLWSSNPEVAEAALKALGQDFCSLPVEDMRICVKETSFYKTAQDGIAWYKSDTFKKNMDVVVDVCKKLGVLTDKVPTIGWGDKTKQLNFDVQYMEKSLQ